MVRDGDLGADLSMCLFGGLPALLLLSSPGTWQFEPFLGGVVCIVWVVVLIAWILVLVWVYRDAEERGMNGALWVIVCFFLGLLGLLLLLAHVVA